MMNKDNNIVSRSIYYYDLFAVIRKGSEVTEEKEAILRSFARIRKLYEDFLDAKKRGEATIAEKLLNDVHYITERGDYLYVLVDEIVDYKIKFRLVRTRTNAYPYIDINGELEKITTKIEGEFDVAEVTHCVIFADKNIMGAEYNSAGARATSLSVLFDERDYGVESLKVLNRIDKKAINNYGKIKNIRCFSLL